MPTLASLPFGAQFSPEQISLSFLLRIADQFSGDKESFEAAVRTAYYDGRNTSDKNKRTLAMNTRLGLRSYGLIESECSLTEIGRELLGVANDEAEMTKRFARHILLNRHGLALLQCVKDIQDSGEQPTLNRLQLELPNYGLDFPSAGTHVSTLRLWLSKAGVVSESGWEVNETRLQEITGTDTGEVRLLASLTGEQKAFLRALCACHEEGPRLSNEVAKLAETNFGPVTFNPKSLPKQVLFPLVEKGLIIAQKTTGGQGSKPFRVSLSAQSVAEILEPILGQLSRQLDSALYAFIRLPLSTILERVQSEDKQVAGLALEALAFKIMRLLDLTYITTRLRSSETGGTEVDLLFKSRVPVFLQWEIQCKRTDSVAAEVIAKEIGVATVVGSNVVVFVTTGQFGPEAIRFAKRAIKRTALSVLMIDGDDLALLKDAPEHIVEILRQQSSLAERLKKDAPEP